MLRSGTVFGRKTLLRDPAPPDPLLFITLISLGVFTLEDLQQMQHFFFIQMRHWLQKTITTRLLYEQAGRYFHSYPEVLI